MKETPASPTVLWVPAREFIISLFCRIDDALPTQCLHPQAKLWPSEIVTLGVLRVLKGLSFRAFHRWVERNLTDLFPNLPERTRLLRLLRTYCDLADTFLAKPKKRGSVGYLDSFGIESAKQGLHGFTHGGKDEAISSSARRARPTIVFTHL